MRDMKTLLETITEAKEKYKKDKVSPILYKLYENGELVYIGIGGCRGNRKGYLRLQEHYKATMPSSLKWKILKIKLSQPTTSNNPLEDAEKYWNSLSWEFENGTNEYITNKEKELIEMYNPKYNIEFNQK
jgi:hypothetical protein